MAGVCYIGCLTMFEQIQQRRIKTLASEETKVKLFLTSYSLKQSLMLLRK